MNAGLRLKLFKCTSGVRKAEIQGHVVDGTGLRSSDKHIEYIQDLLEPAGNEELMTFVDLVSFFSAFLDRFAEMAVSLYEVLKRTRLKKKRKQNQRLVIPD